MYICDRCGDVVEEVGCDRVWHRELDAPYYTDEDECCFCGGDYVEAVECVRCGEYEAENELIFGWCRACVAELCEERGLDLKRDRDEISDIIEEENSEED